MMHTKARFGEPSFKKIEAARHRRPQKTQTMLRANVSTITTNY
jgi:hypothetical protein